MQHAACYMLPPTRNTQHATYNMQHAAHNMQHASCNMHHASYYILHATCYIPCYTTCHDTCYTTCYLRYATHYTLHATCYKLQCSSSLCAFQVSMSNHFVWLPIEEKGDATLVITFACPTLSLPVPPSSITALI